MKSRHATDDESYVGVTLHVRVWIEIPAWPLYFPALFVTLHVRVWIEIAKCTGAVPMITVTLHVRVWIEMMRVSQFSVWIISHPPREGVD